MPLGLSDLKPPKRGAPGVPGVAGVEGTDGISSLSISLQIKEKKRSVERERERWPRDYRFVLFVSVIRVLTLSGSIYSVRWLCS